MYFLPLGMDPVSLFPSTYSSLRSKSLSMPSESVPLNEFWCKYNWVNGNGPDSRNIDLGIVPTSRLCSRNRPCREAKLPMLLQIVPLTEAKVNGTYNRRGSHRWKNEGGRANVLLTNIPAQIEVLQILERTFVIGDWIVICTSAIQRDGAVEAVMTDIEFHH